jgi:nucleoside-diphosphate-sugar epimerase
MKTVAIAGASGVIGLSAVRTFLDAGWRVLALSRRAPAVAPHPQLRHLAVDLADAAACRAALAREGRISHLVYTAVHELPGLVAGWVDKDVMQVNLRMFEHILQPLAEAGALAHVSILQGGKAYGVQFHPAPVPAREDAPRDPHDNFYWLQEDALKASAARYGFRFTILRPPAIFGGAAGAVMNALVPIAMYGALCRELDLPFGFPGGVAKPFDLVDARIVARALHWAAEAPSAAGQTFNVGNGELAEWRTLWPMIADALGLPAAPDRPVSLARFLPEHAPAWEALARKHSLAEPRMEKLLGESHHYADILFGYGVTQAPPYFLISVVKIRQAGFADCMTSEEMFRYWFDDLVRRRIVPPHRS